MLTTGTYLEAIIEMITEFKAKVIALDKLGLMNINKHSENFVKTILNLVYEYDLENLNRATATFPGIDLGDSDRGIAFQVTSNKKSDKVDETLAMCLKHNHYRTFPEINVFVLTGKQGTYTLKTDTEPAFHFLSDDNIWDFDKVLSDVSHLSQFTMEVVHDYIKKELRPTIEAIRNDKDIEAPNLLDVSSSMTKTGMNKFFRWKATVELTSQRIAVPEIFRSLNEFLPQPALKNQLLPMLNPALMKQSSQKESTFIHEVIASGVTNWYTGYAMGLKQSSISVEIAQYSDQFFLVNMLAEMTTLLTQILFFSKCATTPYFIDVKISMEANHRVVFHPNRSLVLASSTSTFQLEVPFELVENVTDIDTKTLADLLQKIMHGFVANEPSIFTNSPYFYIDRNATEFVIDNIKKMLGIPTK